MLAYLQKFNELPTDLRNRVSSPEVMVAISDIEKSYNMSLAALVMRVMIREISILDLSKYFVLEYGLEAKRAESLVEELKQRVFVGVADYLGFSLERQEDSAEGGDDWALGQSGSAIRGSNFFFSSEDEEEVRDLTAKMSNFHVEAAAKKVEDEKTVALKVDKIAGMVNINFSSQELHKRLKQVLATYVKGVRNRLDTKQTLLRGMNEGGLALNDSLANKVLDISEKVMSEEIFPEEAKPDELAGRTEPAPKPSESPARVEPAAVAATDTSARDVPYDFNALRQSKKEETAVQPASETLKSASSGPAGGQSRPAGSGTAKKQIDLDNLDFSVKDTPVELDEIKQTETKPSAGSGQPAQGNRLDLRVDDTGAGNVRRESPPVPGGAESVLNLKMDDSSATGPAAKKAVPIQFTPKTQPSSGKVKMDDVKYVPKLTGPVDELKELSLGDFRRLGENARSRTKKIVEKISFLEQDNYQDRLTGIKAWRQSPVNKLYLSMGQESIAGNLSMAAVINNRTRSNQEALTQEEFNAIMELNKELRF